MATDETAEPQQKSKPTPPTPTLRTGVVCCGLLSETEFDTASGDESAIAIEIVLFVENYHPLYVRAKKLRPSARAHNDFRKLTHDLETGAETDPELDIVTITPPCYDETTMRQYNERGPHPDAELFTNYTSRFVRALRKKPKAVLIEITPSKTMLSHRKVQADFESMGYSCAAIDRLPSCFCGDHTHRDRWWLIATETITPVNIYDHLSRAPSVAMDILDPPELVSPELWVKEPYEPYPGKRMPSDPRAAAPQRSYAVLAGFLNDLFVKEMKVYDPCAGPLPCITRSGLLRVFIRGHGVRFLSLPELARATGFSKHTIEYLESLPFERAMTMISGAVPLGMLKTVYRSVVSALLHSARKNPDAVVQLHELPTSVHWESTQQDSVDACMIAHSHCDVPDVPNFLPKEMFRVDDGPADDFLAHLQGHEFPDMFGDWDFSDELLWSEALFDTDVIPEVETRADPNDDIDITTRATTAKPQGFPSLSSIYARHPEIIEPVQRENAARRAQLLHNIHHCGAHQLEKIIATVSGHGCKPGDSRYVKCDDCDANIDTFKVPQTTKGHSEQRVNAAPGTEFFIDGLYPTVVSKWGGHKYILVAICVKSSLVVLFYMRDLSARSFVAFVNYLRTLVRVRAGATLRKLYGDYFSTHLDQTTVAIMRAQHSIEMEVCPPYLHQRNAYVEGLIRILKIGIRARLRALIGKVIQGHKITDATPYYNFAAEHKAQSLNSTPSVTLERDLGFTATRNQVFDSGTNPHVLPPEDVKLHPFGVDTIVVQQLKKQSNAMQDTAEPASYLFSGTYNFFAHRYSTSPQTNVVLLHSNGKLQVTAKCVFPHLRLANFHSAPKPMVVDEASHDAIDDTTDKLFDEQERRSLPVATKKDDLSARPSESSAPLPLLRSNNNESATDERKHDDGDGPPPPSVPDPPSDTRDDAAPPSVPTPLPNPSSPVRPNPSSPVSRDAVAAAGESPPAVARSPADRRSSLPTMMYRRATPTRLPLFSRPEPSGSSEPPSSLPPYVPPPSQSPAVSPPSPAAPSSSRAATIEEEPRLPTVDEARRTPFAISFRPGVTKSGKSKVFWDYYSGARTSVEFFDKHAQAPGSTAGRANADWKHDTLKARPPLIFYMDPRLRSLQRAETGFIANDTFALVLSDPCPTDEGTHDHPAPRANDFCADTAFTMTEGGAQGMLPTLFSGFEHTPAYTALEDYFYSLDVDCDMKPSLDNPSSIPDPFSAAPDPSSASAKPETSRPPTRMKFHEASARLTELYSHECAEALHITDGEFAYIRNIDYLHVPKDERTHGQNWDLDESFYDSLLYHHIVEGGVDEIVLLAAEPDPVNPDGFIFHEDKIADLQGVPHEQKPKMYSAIVKELTDLAKKGTFADIQIPTGRRPVGSKWVLKVKYRSDGVYDKHKARLVAKGFLQKLGLEFFACYSPMATMTTVRIIFAIAVHLGLDVIHADVPQAFIQSKIDADIWIELPYGTEYKNPVTGESTRILKLLKSLYGLRQAALAWSRHLHEFLSNLGFSQAAKDQCLYYRHTDTGFIIMATEVDDLVITGTSNPMIVELHDALKKAFEIEVFEPIQSFLGMHVQYSKEHGIFEMNMLKKFENLFHTLHPFLGEQINGNGKIPLKGEYSHVLETAHKVTPLELYIKKHYASIVGSLIFIMISVRPDISCAVGKLSRHMHNPLIKHCIMCSDTLNYCMRTKKYKLVYRRIGNPIESVYRELARTNSQLVGLACSDRRNIHPLGGFSDANHAPADDEELRSTSGYAMYVLYCLVSWKSKLQSVTAQSTHESELIALSLASNEAVWIRDLLITLGFALTGHTIVRPRGSEKVPELDHRNDDDNYNLLVKPLTTVFTEEDHDDGLAREIVPYTMPPSTVANDNASANIVANNPSTTFRNRHIGSRYFQVRNYVRNQQLLPTHVPTKLNVADIFTKAITEFQQFETHRRALGLEDPGDS